MSVLPKLVVSRDEADARLLELIQRGKALIPEPLIPTSHVASAMETGARRWIHTGAPHTHG